MKSKSIALIVSSLLWAVFMVSEVNMIKATNSPITYPITYPVTYPVTYPIPTPRPTPSIVPTPTPMPTIVPTPTPSVIPTPTPSIKPTPTPTPIMAIAAISGKIRLIKMPFSRSKVDMSTLKVAFENKSINNSKTLLPVLANGDFGVLPTKAGTYRLTPVSFSWARILFIPSSITINVKAHEIIKVDFIGLIY